MRRPRATHRVDPARVDLEWLRGRVAWQAVSDAAAGLQAQGDAIALCRQRLKQAVARGIDPPLPYFSSTVDAERCAEEMQRLYDLVTVLLGGGLSGPERDGAPPGRSRRWPFAAAPGS